MLGKWRLRTATLTLLIPLQADTSGQTAVSVSLVNPGASSVPAGIAFDLEVIATFDRRLTAVSFQLSASGDAGAQITGRSADPDEPNGLTYISITSQDPFEANLPHDFAAGPLLEVLTDMDYDDLPGGDLDGLLPGSDVLIEHVQITPTGSGSLTLTLSDLEAISTQDDPDSVLFDSMVIDQDAVTVTVTASAWTGHPADTGYNWSIQIEEVTGYGSCWKTGGTWPLEPNPIPIEYVTRCGLLWKVGEVYHYDAGFDCPLCWQPGVLVGQSKESVPSDRSGFEPAGSAVIPETRTKELSSGWPPTPSPILRQAQAGEHQPAGHRFIEPGDEITGCCKVRVEVGPPIDAEVWAVGEAPPPGWNVVDINQAGSFDAATGKVKWGPFFDNRARTLLYTVIRPDGADPAGTVSGVTSVDGLNTPVTGDYCIAGIDSARRDTPDGEETSPEAERDGEERDFTEDGEAPPPFALSCGAGLLQACLCSLCATFFFWRGGRRFGSRPSYTWSLRRRMVPWHRE